MGGFWEGFEGDLIGFWAVAAELLAVACFYLLLLTFACFGLLWLALPALAALSVPLLLRFSPCACWFRATTTSKTKVSFSVIRITENGRSDTRTVVRIPDWSFGSPNATVVFGTSLGPLREPQRSHRGDIRCI